MATRQALTTQPVRGVLKVVWSGLLNGDQGSSEDLSDYPDQSVQITGTFGVGGSVNIEGSNDGSTFAILNDSRGEGNALTLTAADLRQILEGVVGRVRPNVTAGDGSTNLVVTLTARRALS